MQQKIGPITGRRCIPTQREDETEGQGTTRKSAGREKSKMPSMTLSKRGNLSVITFELLKSHSENSTPPKNGPLQSLVIKKTTTRTRRGTTKDTKVGEEDDKEEDGEDGDEMAEEEEGEEETKEDKQEEENEEEGGEVSEEEEMKFYHIRSIGSSANGKRRKCPEE